MLPILTRWQVKSVKGKFIWEFLFYMIV
jgi:hypothetical protein